MKRVGDVIESLELRSIKTEYQGVLFRSRLEARWAHFFDLIGVAWAYEAEGFELPSGRYLPDFEINLGEERCFFEVKPCEPSFDERRRAEQLAAASGRRVFVTWGPPDNDDEADGIEAFYIHGVATVQELGFRFCICPRCERIGCEYEGRGARVCGKRCLPDSDRAHTGDVFASEARVAKARRYWNPSDDARASRTPRSLDCGPKGAA